jgi:hypothetical protein
MRSQCRWDTSEFYRDPLRACALPEKKDLSARALKNLHTTHPSITTHSISLHHQPAHFSTQPLPSHSTEHRKDVGRKG